jgi:hypothetical protein
LINLFILIVALTLSGCGSSSVNSADTESPVVQPELVEILISGLSVDEGNFDPAPTIDENATLWMSYSHVSNDASGIKLIETRLASSGDGGSNWQDVVNINMPVLSIINTSQAATAHEVSRLIYNPFASAVGADPWLIMWHRYLSL